MRRVKKNKFSVIRYVAYPLFALSGTVGEEGGEISSMIGLSISVKGDEEGKAHEVEWMAYSEN